MSKERRVAPRTICAVPVRFRVRTDIFAPKPQQRACVRGDRTAPTFAPDVLDGETVNISALGIYFKTREHVAFGEELEMSFRLPGELTGRTAEDSGAPPASFTSMRALTAKALRESALRLVVSRNVSPEKLAPPSRADR